MSFRPFPERPEQDQPVHRFSRPFRVVPLQEEWVLLVLPAADLLFVPIDPEASEVGSLRNVTGIHENSLTTPSIA